MHTEVQVYMPVCTCRNQRRMSSALFCLCLGHNFLTGLSLNVELGWQLANSSNTCGSSLHKLGSQVHATTPSCLYIFSLT